VRYFFSSGEASGESSAVLLAQAIRTIDPQAEFEGIGADRMRAAGFAIWRDHTGWASMGPLAAIPRIPKLLATMWRTAFHIAAVKPDLVVLVDFGVFNLRLAMTLRRLRYAGPILDMFPPATWLDNEKKARAVSAVAVPLTAFAHQSEFYRNLGCPIAYFGHPLTGEYRSRPSRPAPPLDGGTIAVLPGSRSGELRCHLPRLMAAYRLLQARRPNVRAVFGAADDRGAERIARDVEREGLTGVEIVRGVGAAIGDVDAAWVASGTAVLETVLSGVPAVALYVITPILVKHGRTMIKHGFITLPNLILKRRVVPELLQEEATPERLVDEIDAVLRDPSQQYARFAELRAALGPPDALARCAEFAVSLARNPGAAFVGRAP
jgi:lipid-A-disaccharide synthase